MRRAAIYTRISSDPSGERAGVARQQRDCEALVVSLGWELADTYTDNDRSAYSGRRRPEYERLLTDIQAGTVDALVAWHPDRLHRSPIELEHFIDIVQKHGVTIATVNGGSYDLSTATGQMMARVVGAVARAESDHKAERHRAKHLDLARQGKPSGGGDRPYGYEDDRVTIRESEAVHIKDAAARLLAGETLRSVTIHLNESGSRTTAGGTWVPANLRRLMKSARIAGLRSHKGEVIGPAIWPGIINEADHIALRAIFDQNAARMVRAPRSYLLTGGLAVCGVCGANLVARPRADGQRCYICAKGIGFKGCGKIRILAEPFEDWVKASVSEAIRGPGLIQALAEETDVDTAAVLAEIHTLEESLDQLAADHYADNVLSRHEYLAAKDAIDTKLFALNEKLAPNIQHGLLLDDVLFFEGKELQVQRQIVELIVDQVIVNAAVKGRNFFDPDRIDIRWKA